VVEQFESETDSPGECLAESMLDALPLAVLDFLFATSVPDRVCGELASVLAGISDGHAQPERMVARDLFLAKTGDDRCRRCSVLPRNCLRNTSCRVHDFS